MVVNPFYRSSQLTPTAKFDGAHITHGRIMYLYRRCIVYFIMRFLYIGTITMRGNYRFRSGFVILTPDSFSTNFPTAVSVTKDDLILYLKASILLKSNKKDEEIIL